MSGFFFGIRCFIKGFGVMWRPTVLPWAVIPMILSAAIYAGLFWFAADWVKAGVDEVVREMPGIIAAFLGALVWLFLWMFVIWVAAVSFVVTVSIVASPFNGPLAAAAQKALTGRPPKTGRAGVFFGLPRLLVQETKKLLYAALLSIPFLILFVIPVVNVAAPVIWFFWAAWVAALAYADYALDANGLLFRDMRRVLGRHRGAAFGFGGAVVLALTVPLLNVVAVPAAVCGGTVLWLERLAPDSAAGP